MHAISQLCSGQSAGKEIPCTLQVEQCSIRAEREPIIQCAVANSQLKCSTNSMTEQVRW